MGLIASVLVGGAMQLVSDRPVSPDEVFWKSVQEARKLALRSEHEVSFQFVQDDANKTREFVVSDGSTRQEYPVPAAGDLEVTFLAAQAAGGNMILIAGTAVETQKVPVTFYPDGTCTAFRTQFYRNGAVHTLSIDPWTCAPVLTPTDPNAPKS